MSISDQDTVIVWPEKTREMHNHHMDSTRWNDIEFRDDDVVIATWAKSGTTWLQQIVGQLIFEGAEDVPILDLAPWVDLRGVPKDEVLDMLEGQTNRRSMKTHLPVDALVFSPQAKYIYIGRDGRDTLWSLYNHHSRGSQMWYQMLNETPGLIGPPLEPPPSDIRQYFHEWLDQDGYPFWPFWSNIQSWWDIRHLPNVLLLHFNNLKADMPGEIRRIAAFLNIDIDNKEAWEAIIEHCSFQYMRENASRLTPLFDQLFEGGGKSFIHKGSNGRWRDVLTPADIQKYEGLAREKLTPECMHWLASGE